MKTGNRHQRIPIGIAAMLTATLVAMPSSAQVTLVKDINEGAGGTYIFRAGALGNAIYFSAFDGVHGEELWVSDGTEVGTYLVKDIWLDTTTDSSEAFSSKPQQFLAGPSGMYFMAAHREEPGNEPIHDINLWLSNGHQEPEGFTSIVSGFELALVNSLANAVVMAGDLFITGWDENNGVELWKVSGTSATRLTDIEPGVGGSFPGDLTVVGGTLFFSAINTELDGPGTELWISDGTPGGETVIDFFPGTEGLGPSGITAFDGEVYFSGSTLEEGRELWASNGTVGGTRMVADIAPGYNESSYPTNLVPVGDQLFFIASEDAGYNYDLWVYGHNGVDWIAQKVKADGTPLVFESVAYDGKFFFTANDPDAGKELWVSDGTDAGTHLVTDIYPGTYFIDGDEYPNSSEPTELTVAGDYLFFRADDGVHGPSLWVTDGTEAGTFMVANLFDYFTEEGPKGLTATTDRLFFQTESAGSGRYGREVHSLLTANVVKPPAAPTGEETGSTETAYTYSTTGGSVSLDGEPVQYRFHWGDGEPSGWLDLGVTTAEHTWHEAGTYDVTVEARSTVMTSITSNHSAALSVLMSFSETVDVSMTSGPETGEIWVEYEFTFAGSSDYGHDLEFSIDWGDGSDPTEWASFNPATGVTVSNDWDDIGEKTITASLRCTEHTDVTDSVVHLITIEDETLDTPTVDGPTTGWTDTEYSFTVGGGSSAGHDLQYIVHWDASSNTGWQPFGEGRTSIEVSHTWSVAETFPLEVGVRCATHDHVDSWFYDHSIEISAPPDEELTGPDLQHMGGDWNGYPDASLGFTLTASSNLDHDLQYRVTWGDGGDSGWADFGAGETSVELSHTWTAQVTDTTEYFVDVWVRCKDHHELENWGQWSVWMVPEAVSDRSLTGPASGVAGVSYDYTLTAHTHSGHAMEYKVWWGYGSETVWQDLDPATGTADLSHAWPVDGADHEYQVGFDVRCRAHTWASDWSSITVSIPGETILNHTLDGPTEGLVGVDQEFTVTGTSSQGHTLQYKFDWGDGFPTEWQSLGSGSASETYHWGFAGEFTVKGNVRCATHDHVLSEKTTVVTVTSDTPPGWIFGDGFESGGGGQWSSSVGMSQ